MSSHGADLGPPPEPERRLGVREGSGRGTDPSFFPLPARPDKGADTLPTRRPAPPARGWSPGTARARSFARSALGRNLYVSFLGRVDRAAAASRSGVRRVSPCRRESSAPGGRRAQRSSALRASGPSDPSRTRGGSGIIDDERRAALPPGRGSPRRPLRRSPPTRGLRRALSEGPRPGRRLFDGRDGARFDEIHFTQDGMKATTRNVPSDQATDLSTEDVAAAPPRHDYSRPRSCGVWSRAALMSCSRARHAAECGLQGRHRCVGHQRSSCGPDPGPSRISSRYARRRTRSSVKAPRCIASGCGAAAGRAPAPLVRAQSLDDPGLVPYLRLAALIRELRSTPSSSGAQRPQDSAPGGLDAFYSTAKLVRRRRDGGDGLHARGRDLGFARRPRGARGPGRLRPRGGPPSPGFAAPAFHLALIASARTNC